MDASDLTIAVPTYNRPSIVVDALRLLLALDPPPHEILVIDQTPAANPQLAAWDSEGKIRWIRLDHPSIPHAMNEGLLRATTEVVLFLDDDIVPPASIVALHAAAYESAATWAVVGQFLEVGEEPQRREGPFDRDGISDLELRFNHDAGRFVSNVVAANLSMRRERALAAGGFDENFVGVAYRFETDFALRLNAAGGRIFYHPDASVRHLRIPTGGTRTWGEHRTSISPMHSVGDYYFALHHAPQFWLYVAKRLRSNVLTRFHLRHPWRIPQKLLGETRGLLMAFRLVRGGRKLI